MTNRAEKFNWEKVASLLSPFILASIVGLGSWVNRIEERQYAQMTLMASKIELKETQNQLNDTLRSFIQMYDKQRSEDREAFRVAIGRIEARQVSTGRKVDELVDAVTKVSLIATVNQHKIDK